VAAARLQLIFVAGIANVCYITIAQLSRLRPFCVVSLNSFALLETVFLFLLNVSLSVTYCLVCDVHHTCVAKQRL